MERTDNLRVEILDKSNYLLKLLNREIQLDEENMPISVNVVDRTIENLSDVLVTAAILQSSNNAYVWISKTHD